MLAGVDGKSSSRQLIEHNLVGTINLLEHSKVCRAGFILLSTSRVYGIEPLATLELKTNADAFAPVDEQRFPVGLSRAGIAESFSTASPISLYGATKLASETLALEYGGVFDFPVWINRCGVLAGAGQFGRADPGPRPFDLPWIVMDSSLAGRAWDWHPRIRIESILEEIAQHAEANPDWLDLVGR